MKLIAFKLVISAVRSWLLKGQQNRSKMPINIFAKQIMFPVYETNFSTSFFIPANKLKIQHLFIWHLILNSCRTACIGSIQDIWRIWAFNIFLFCIWFWIAAELLVLALYRTFDAYEPGQYVTVSNLVQELPLPNTAVKGQACARGSILAGCAAISGVKFQGKHEK